MEVESWPADNTAEAAAEPEIPSCHGCRRRKLRCSREQPTCSHCRRLDSPCVYDAKRNKPGLKPGAVSNLTRRVEALEESLQRVLTEHHCGQNSHVTLDPQPSSAEPNHLLQILSTLASELGKLNSTSCSRPRGYCADGSGQEALPSPLTSQTSTLQVRNETAPHSGIESRKRRRMDSCGNPSLDLSSQLEQTLESFTTALPEAGLLEEVVDIYFDLIQPWIPILHETRFRRRVQDPSQLPQVLLILHAIVVAALRFVQRHDTPLAAQEIEKQVSISRQIVVLSSMDSLSIENLQALVIIAFNDIGNGEASKAWSIIGSLSRTVEYLQLSVEPDHYPGKPLLKPLSIISGPENWTEEEQRRRVFWNIFCLDRLCSITTGWNTSLTSDDVQRRLPADGGLWHKEEIVTTPYLGIWDRSMAKISNSIAFLPENYPSPEHTQDKLSSSPSGTGQAKYGPVDMTTVGAFAYRIEATESLSRITTCFLQQRINFHDREEVSNWLTRFKELDLRLVHWKMFLPQRWRDSNISRQPDSINMDPNLTLAHVTHNTSMILLHQRIAYPDPKWPDSLKLPSLCSAETCQVAAVETTTITRKYLTYTSRSKPVADQYAFCVFISARVLLIHWRHYAGTLDLEFHDLVQSLDEMARRWTGPVLTYVAEHCLAGKYASHLRLLHSLCESDPHFTIDVLGYTHDMAPRSVCRPFLAGYSPYNVTQADLAMGTNPQAGIYHHDKSNGQQLPGSLNLGRCAQPSGVVNHVQGSTRTPSTDACPDQLSSISHMLLDEDFLSMDRVISLEDMIFTAPANANGFTWAAQGPANS